jgi:hypothetical protein
MSRSVRIDEDLFLKAQEVAKLNGISVKSYVNGLVEKVLRQEQREAAVSKDLEHIHTLGVMRLKLADETFEAYDFGRAVIETHDRWDIFKTTYAKNVYYKLPNDPRDTPTHMRVFHIEFKDGSAEIASIHESISVR